MRLVTWNCRSGPYDLKTRALRKLQFDVAVVPESPKPAVNSNNVVWDGQSPHRGLLIAASNGYQLERVRMRHELPRLVIPIRVSGPTNFLLIAIWALQNDEPRDRYVRGVVRAIDRCRRLMKSSPTVLLGDFNSNTFWDTKYSRNANHTSLVRQLRDLGCVSAYHAFRGEEHGSESVPTYFQYNHSDKPYHLDYCFVPNSWTERIRRVTVGAHEQWSRWSDHRPVIVDL